MQNKIVIYTCITGGYDTFDFPIKNKEPGIDYVIFTDDLNLKCDGWEIRGIPCDLLCLSKVKQSKLIKILPHKYLSKYDISIWMDGGTVPYRSINDFVSKYDLEKHFLYVSKHPKRNCIYEEQKAVVQLKRDSLENIEPQIAKYKKENFPENYGLTENRIMLRKHNEKKCQTLMNMWATEVLKGSFRDQLSFMYCLWKLNLEIGYLEPFTYSAYLEKNPWFYVNRKHEKNYNTKISKKNLMVWTHGRFGNVLFQYVVGKYIASKFGFNLYLMKTDYMNNWFEKNLEFSNIFKKEMIVENPMLNDYTIIIEKTIGRTNFSENKNFFLRDYFENPMLWNNDKKFVFDIVQPEDGLLDAIKNAYDIDFENFVSVNVRRGDYLNEDVQKRLGLLSQKWFEICMSYFPKNQNFFITSDDIEYCKSIFKGNNFVFADKKIPGFEKMFVDLWVQTLCKDNIISNSTFSWWGAYLNKNNNRKVFYPYPFFKLDHTRNKIPLNDNWIEIPFDPIFAEKAMKEMKKNGN